MNGYDDPERADGADEGLRLGEIAIRKGYLDPALLELALREQLADVVAGGAHRPVGQILVERGWLTPWELEDAIMTLADIASGIERTGATPSEAIPLARKHDWLDPAWFDTDPRLEDGFVARTYPRSLAVAAKKTKSARPCASDVMSPAPWTTRDARLGDALDAAFDGSSEIVLVVEGGELEGVIEIGEACQDNRRARVGSILSPLTATVTEHTPLDEVASILREHDVPCVIVLASGRPVGVITRRRLRSAGVAGVDPETIAYEELGVAG